MMRIIVALVALGLATPASASEWWFVAKSGEKPARDLIYLDRESILPQGDFKTFWTKIYHESEPNHSEMVQWRLDCNRRAYNIERFSVYDGRGGVLKTDNTPSREEPIIPDSSADSFRKFICEKPDGVKIGDLDRFAETSKFILKTLDEYDEGAGADK